MWLRVEATFPRHAKVEEMRTRCGQDMVDRVIGLWVRAACWAAENLTDGFVPQWFVRTKRQMACADELVKARLWKQAKEGYQIHDFLKYNYSKVEVERVRELGRQRQTKLRERKAQNGEVTALQARDDGVSLPVLTSPVLPEQKDLVVTPEEAQQAREDVLTLARGLAGKMAMPK